MWGLGNYESDIFLLHTPECFSTRRYSERVGRPFRQFLLGETPKTGLPHHATGSPAPPYPYPPPNRAILILSFN